MSRPRGLKLSEETRRKISNSKIKIELPKNGVIELSSFDGFGVVICDKCGKSRKLRYDTACKITTGRYKNLCASCVHTGKVLSETHKKSIGVSGVGSKNGNWKGGNTQIIRALRREKRYRVWKRLVLKRDNSRCIICNSTENIQVDHIKSFTFFPDSRYDISNGRVLCFNCHKKTANYGNSKR